MTLRVALIGVNSRILGLQETERQLIGCGYRTVGSNDLNPSVKPNDRSELLTAYYI